LIYLTAAADNPSTDRRQRIAEVLETVRLVGYEGRKPIQEVREAGRIRDVVYAGMITRFVVELDRGGELTVVSQNLDTSSADVDEQRGRGVVLDWRSEHTFGVTDEPEKREAD
jgi:putative spermidine/putrescine transport system ATP-binding protein